MVEARPLSPSYGDTGGHFTGDPLNKAAETEDLQPLEWQTQDLHQSFLVSKSRPFNARCLPFRVLRLMSIPALLAKDDRQPGAHVWIQMVMEED